MDWVDGVVVLGLLLFIVFCFTRFSLPKEGESSATNRRGAASRTTATPRRRDFGGKATPRSPLARLRFGQKLIGRKKINVEPLPEAAPELPLDQMAALRRPLPAKVDLKGLDGMGQIRALDPSFDDTRFLKKAAATYEALVKAWNKGDEKALQQLCAPRLTDALLAQLDTAEERGEKVKIKLDGPAKAELVDGRVHGRTAIVTVTYLLNQQQGDGAAVAVEKKATLARALTSEDPAWEVQQISLTD